MLRDKFPSAQLQTVSSPLLHIYIYFLSDQGHCLIPYPKLTDLTAPASAETQQTLKLLFKISSLKVKGLNHLSKRYSLWMEACKPQCDILCLQETHLCQDKAPNLSHKNYSHIFYANSPTKTKGVLIAIKDTASFKQISTIADPQGRYRISS